jgi:hypothetical protein
MFHYILAKVGLRSQIIRNKIQCGTKTQNDYLIRVCDTLCIKNKVPEMNIFFKEIFVPLTLYYYFYEQISVKLCAWQNYFYI